MAEKMKQTENQRFKIARKKLGFTQPDFGSVVDVSITYISKIENEEMEVPESIKNKVCSTLNISNEWWETGKGEMWKSGNDHENIDRARSMLKGNASKANPWEAEAYKQVTAERDSLKEQVQKLTQALLNLSIQVGGKGVSANFNAALEYAGVPSYMLNIEGTSSGAQVVN